MKVLLLVLVAGLMPVFAFAYDGSGYPAYLGSGTKCHTDGDWMECTHYDNARRGPNGGWIIPQTKCHRDSITGDVDCQSD